MSEKNIAVIKERLKVDLEKLKISATVVILLTGGLIGLLFKEVEILQKIILFIMGTIADMVFVFYLLKLNNSIKYLLKTLEVENV